MKEYIFGKSKGDKNINDCKYEIELKHRDSIKNEYISIINGQGAYVARLETRVI